MIKSLFTIGYTGLKLDDFIAELEGNNVKLLLDVREIPISRKRGFSKNALAEALEQSGIRYCHFKWLGSPKELRHEVRETRDYKIFFKGVTRHLQQPPSILQLEESVQLARRNRACLMCCCEDWQLCHRSCVVDAMLKIQYFSVDHLRDPSAQDVNKKVA